MGYCTRNDVLAVLSQDQEARLTNDPTDQVYVATADGWQTKFDLPFARTTTLKPYLNNVLQTTGWTLLPYGGSDPAVDAIQFTVAPLVGVVLTASADQRAVYMTVVDQAIKDASDEMDSYLVRYQTPVTSAAILRLIRPKVVTLAKYRMRGRRDLGQSPAALKEQDRLYDWLTRVATGKIALVVAEQTGVSNPVMGDSGALYGGEDSTFDAPYSGTTILRQD